MQMRTVYCKHGFIVPGRPEPWTIPASEGGVERRISRFCSECWRENANVFLALLYAQTDPEDQVQFGFTDLIQSVIGKRGFVRDAERYQFLEIELRQHLVNKRKQIEAIARDHPKQLRSYVFVALSHKLQDLQQKSEAKLEQNSTSIDDEFSMDRGGATDDRDPSDENQVVANIMQETIANDTGKRLSTSTLLAPKSRKPRSEPKEEKYFPKSRSRAKENAELLRKAIEEQGHRLNSLNVLTQRENERELEKAHRDVLKAIKELPKDEQKVMQLRFVQNAELRNGKPRPRSDILHELRSTGNGSSRWTESDLRRLERQAVIRLRGKVRLPSIFRMRD